MGGSGLGDPDDIRWSWIGSGRKGKKGSGHTLYDHAKVQRLSDGATRRFSVGDPVFVASDPDQQPWVAHLVEMFQIGDSTPARHGSDSEIQVVEDNSVARRMRCTLRWFYYPSDVSDDSKRLHPMPKPLESEIYFSDHVEDHGSNGLEVIEGRAFLCATEKEAQSVKANYPEDYWEGDAVCIVRCFYGTSCGDPPPIRELEKGELDYLLKHPSTDQDLFQGARPAMYGVHGAVMKGTGRKRRRPVPVEGTRPARGKAASSPHDKASASAPKDVTSDSDRSGEDVPIAVLSSRMSDRQPRHKRSSEKTTHKVSPKEVEDTSSTQKKVAPKAQARGSPSRVQRKLKLDDSSEARAEQSAPEKTVVEKPSVRSQQEAPKSKAREEEHSRTHAVAEKRKKDVSATAKRQKVVAGAQQQTVLEPSEAAVAAMEQLSLHFGELSLPGKVAFTNGLDNIIDTMLTQMSRDKMTFSVTEAQVKQLSKHLLEEFSQPLAQSDPNFVRTT